MPSTLPPDTPYEDAIYKLQEYIESEGERSAYSATLDHGGSYIRVELCNTSNYCYNLSYIEPNHGEWYERSNQLLSKFEVLERLDGYVQGQPGVSINTFLWSATLTKPVANVTQFALAKVSARGLNMGTEALLKLEPFSERFPNPEVVIFILLRKRPSIGWSEYGVGAWVTDMGTAERWQSDEGEDIIEMIKRNDAQDGEAGFSATTDDGASSGEERWPYLSQGYGLTQGLRVRFRATGVRNLIHLESGLF